jgi:OFA family oxalate/formate antiporter-like MFS transporter
MTTTASISHQPRRRWVQLWSGVLCMALIANLQYAWTLFVEPMHLTRGWSIGQIQWAFSIFIATETWLTPVGGYLVDRLGPKVGPRTMIAIGGVLVGSGWAINAFAPSLAWLYAGAAISGTGAGGIYATCVGNAVKWYPERRGLAVGLTAAGFGGGAALTVIPIKAIIDGFGYQYAFLSFGIGQGILLLALAAAIAGPDQTATMPRPAAHLRQSQHSATSLEMLRSPIFWLLYVMFLCVSASGLMATAQLGPIARDWGLANTPLLFGAGTLSCALVIDNVMNGVARPFFGWVSDRIGREPTMAIAFTLGAASYWLLAEGGNSPWAFVLCAGLIFFTWGEIFSLFPSTCTDTFGPRYATANTALLYTAKGTSAFLVPLANTLKNAAGGWEAVFLTAAVTNGVVVVLALLVLRPMRQNRLRRALLLEAGNG